MYREISQIREVSEMEAILNENDLKMYFSFEELKLIENRNRIKSLGARYLIKQSILDYLKLDKNYLDIEIENDSNGKPVISFRGSVNDKLKENNVNISISHSKNFISTLVVIEENV